MTQKKLEDLIGMLALLVLVALTLPLWKRADSMVQGHAAAIQVRARFDDIGGLVENAPVRSAGVAIGHVTSISLDRATHRGVVVMAIDDGVRFPVDSLASIHNAGLMGNEYVGIEAGSGRRNLGNGGVIEQTSSAVILEDVIEHVVSGGGARAGVDADASAGPVVVAANRRP
jgi:phospholipid/cholesterol/gamma-HCH transport system substrate-binding protein